MSIFGKCSVYIITIESRKNHIVLHTFIIVSSINQNHSTVREVNGVNTKHGRRRWSITRNSIVLCKKNW